MIIVIGDRVRLDPKSDYFAQSKGQDGTVLSIPIEYPPGWVEVKWNYGYQDGYPIKDLIFEQEAIDKVKEEFGI